MPITHTNEYGIYHWDTFDNETILVGEANTLVEAKQKVVNKYGPRLRRDGADRVDIVDLQGNVIEKYRVG